VSRHSADPLQSFLDEMKFSFYIMNRRVNIALLLSNYYGAGRLSKSEQHAFDVAGYWAFEGRLA
jgi:hypothetical protein